MGAQEHTRSGSRGVVPRTLTQPEKKTIKSGCLELSIGGELLVVVLHCMVESSVSIFACSSQQDK
jgi:hypothetical protein